MSEPFVPEDFAVPAGLVSEAFVLARLGPRHNERDHVAWSTSIDHVRSTPGFGRDYVGWPRPMTREDNLRDLERHAADFARRRGFTYSVIDPADGDVIGCVYIYPADDSESDAAVRSWVRATRAELDVELWRAVSEWLAREWPFRRVAYAPRA